MTSWTMISLMTMNSMASMMIWITMNSKMKKRKIMMTIPMHSLMTIRISNKRNQLARIKLVRLHLHLKMKKRTKWCMESRLIQLANLLWKRRRNSWRNPSALMMMIIWMICLKNWMIWMTQIIFSMMTLINNSQLEEKVKRNSQRLNKLIQRNRREKQWLTMMTMKMTWRTIFKTSSMIEWRNKMFDA